MQVQDLGLKLPSFVGSDESGKPCQHRLCVSSHPVRQQQEQVDSHGDDIEVQFLEKSCMKTV